MRPETGKRARILAVRRAVALAVADCISHRPGAGGRGLAVQPVKGLTEEHILLAVLAEMEIRARHPGAATPEVIERAEQLVWTLRGAAGLPRESA